MLLKNRLPWLKLLVIYISYLIIIHLTISLAATHLQLSSQVHTIKELYFAVWGYGWDGWHYLTIATHGYHFPNQAFFPLYPLIIRMLDWFLPLTLAYRVNIIILPLLLASLWLFLKDLKIEADKALIAICTFMSFPTSFYLQANYPETLYLLFCAWGLMMIHQKKFKRACLFALLAGLTRPQGLIFIPLIMISYLQTKSVKNIYVLLTSIYYGLFSALGTASYFVYLQLKFGSARIFFEAQQEWYRSSGNITHGLIATIKEAWRMITLLLVDFPLVSRQIIDICFILFFVVLLVKFRGKLSWQLWWYSAWQLLLPLLSGGTISAPRFILSAFPLLLILGLHLAAKPLALIYYLAISISLQVIFIQMFLNNSFVA